MISQPIAKTRQERARQNNPPCMFCGASRDKVANVGAGSKGEYVYKCNVCDVKFQQKPPSQVNAGDRTIPRKVLSRNSKAYSCTKCGATPKKGHICTVIREINESLKDKDTLDALTPKTCLCCGLGLQPGVEDYLLPCISCTNFNIHFTCLPQSTTTHSWLCPVCIIKKQSN